MVDVLRRHCGRLIVRQQRQAARVAVEQPVSDPVVVAVEFDALDDAPAVGQVDQLAFVEQVAFKSLEPAVGAGRIRLPNVSASPPTTTPQAAVFWNP
jgi:hypothetical protein